MTLLFPIHRGLPALRTASKVATLGRLLLVSLSVIATLARPLALHAADAAGAVSVKGTAEFGFDFYRQLTSGADYSPERGKNVVVSPYSIACVLAVLRSGATGAVEKELNAALHVSASGRNSEPSLSPRLEGIQKGTLTAANSLWVAESIPLKKDFLTQTKKDFGSVIYSVDFADRTAACERINSWVLKNTNQRIPKLFSPADFDSATLLAIANAVFFKAKWQTPFPKDATAPAPFKLASGKEVPVPMMRNSVRASYAEVDGVQVLELPYATEAVSMVLLLPPPDGASPSLSKLEKKLSEAWFAKATAKLESKEVEVSLPRFTFGFEPSDSIGVLRRLGVKSMFESTPDFSKIYDKVPLKVGAFKHKAWLEVNEEGTEAAAATGAAMRMMAAPVFRPVFTADRPFLFIIRTTATGLPLFVGRVSNPVEK